MKLMHIFKLFILVLCLFFCYAVQAQAQMTVMAGLYVPAEIAKENRVETEHCTFDESRAKVLGADRYGALFVAVFCEGDKESYQEHMLRKGIALLVMPEMGEYPAHWREAQEEARREKRGVWEVIVPLSADEISNMSSLPEWAIVRGRVHAIAKRDFGTYINFSDDWKEDFTLFVHKQHRREFGTKWLESLVGKEVEVVGRIYSSYGPMMYVTHKTHIKVFEFEKSLK